MLCTRTKWLKEADPCEIPEENGRLSGEFLEFAANLTFMSSLPGLKMKLSAAFYQRMTSDGGYHVIPPMLSIHVIIPDNSEIFGLVMNNDLPGIVNMFEQGRASLRDCDTKGRSLLSVSNLVPALVTYLTNGISTRVMPNRLILAVFLWNVELTWMLWKSSSSTLMGKTGKRSCMPN